MNRIVLYGLLLAAIGLTAASAVVHGRISGRWGANEKSLALGQRLKQFPDTTGNWTTRESSELGRDTANLLQCTGYVNRVFANEQTQQVLSAVVLLGPAGPISVHTPDICYSSREYVLLQPPQKVQILDAAEEKSEFWAMTFQSTRFDRSLLRVYYAYSMDGRWVAADHPRFEYMGKPFLFKIQLAASLPMGADLEKNDICPTFLKDFVPAFRRHMFPQERPDKESDASRQARQP